MAELLTIEFDFTGMERSMRILRRGVPKVLKRVIKRTGDKAFRRTRNRTPVSRGKARGSWKRIVLKGGLVVRIQGGGPTAPYINVLEFGGYPVRDKTTARRTPGSFARGGAVLGGLPPGRRTRRAPRAQGLDPPAEPSGRPLNSNVSKQAPRGMLRITFKELESEFARDLERALDRLFAEAD